MNVIIGDESLTNERVMICCVSFETVKVLDPVFHYKADRVHIIHSGKKRPYIDFFDHVTEVLDENKIDWKDYDIYYSDFTDVMKTVRSIILEEKEQGNFVYVNVGAGPQVYSSAAMIASMMEGAIPFNAPTDEFTIFDFEKHFYKDGKPIGNASKVKAPIEIPTFDVNPPDHDLIIALSIWKDLTEKYKRFATTEIMMELERIGLFENIWEDDSRKKRSQSALMRYRRNFLEKWEANGWIEKSGRGSYSITKQGEMMLDIFS